MGSTFAYDFTVNGIFYKIKEDNTKVAVTLSSNTGNSYAGDIVIPPTVTYNNATYTVTQIYPFAFASCHDLTSVVIPNSIDSIEEGVFWGCIKLTSISIPASVKEIGYYTFVGDTTLTDINVDVANTKFKSVQGVLYNKNLNVLYAYPAGKTALSYTISSSVDSVMTSAFGYSRFNTLIIPSTVKYMEHAAIMLCDKITDIALPALNEFRNNPFYYCKNLKSVTVDPNSTSIESVEGIIFKKGLSTLIYYPPAKTGSSYVIPSSVNYVRSSAFMNCLNLTSITIPASVATIRSGMLEGCTNLTSINAYRPTPVDLTNTTPDEDAGGVFKGVDTLHCVLHVPIGSRELYATAYQWKGFSNIVEGFAAGFTATKTSNLSVTTLKKQINISGYTPGEEITIYNTQGMTLYRQNASSSNTSILLETNGVFIVKVGVDRVKFYL